MGNGESGLSGARGRRSNSSGGRRIAGRQRHVSGRSGRSSLMGLLLGSLLLLWLPLWLLLLLWAGCRAG